MNNVAFWVNKIHCGDCAQVMKEIPPSSIDCIVTDPPYGISFMGKQWDKALPKKEAFMQMYRVLKPGGLAFVMSSPRQDVLWRMMQMLEECHFELKQSFISWIYKTGFPKAYDVSKGIDKKFGAIRKTVKTITTHDIRANNLMEASQGKNLGSMTYNYTAPATELAQKWDGYKSITGLKPALECILMVNKPFSEKTIVKNVLKHGTGAINVDACRIPHNEPLKLTDRTPRIKDNVFNDDSCGFKKEVNHIASASTKGRFPANLLVSDKALDLVGRQDKGTKPHLVKSNVEKYDGWGSITKKQGEVVNYGDSGGASRYFDLDAWAKHHGFLDVPKPSKKERERGLSEFPLRIGGGMKGTETLSLKTGSGNVRNNLLRNNYPTVKPVKLMAYLIELGCPPDGIVLDPFVGSGTTCVAAKRFERQWIGIEINPDYAKIASARVGDTNIVAHQSESTQPTRVKKQKVTTRQRGGKPKCGYNGKCTFRNVDGFCEMKRHCKDKVIEI